MYETRSGYDHGVSTFSPEGRLFQLEYALKAIGLASCSVAIKTKEGVILAAERRMTSPLMEKSSVEKIVEIDSHLGVAISGLTADARTLVDHARVESQNHRFTYDEGMRTESLAQTLSDVMISFGEGSEERSTDKIKMARPFGVALLIAGIDKDGTPQLMHIDPSGTCVAYQAHSIGNGAEGAMSMLQERYDKEMTFTDAETLVGVVLRQTMEERITKDNVEFASVTPGRGFRHYAAAEVEAVLERAAAQQAEDDA